MVTTIITRSKSEKMKPTRQNENQRIKNSITWLLLLILVQFGWTQSRDPIYSIPDQPWMESLGNHRAVLRINKPAPAVHLDITWRRHDTHVESKHYLIIEAATGDTIQNIKRIWVNNEKCELVIGPVKNAGIYYFYYLPYQIQTNYGFYNRGYFSKEKTPDPKWVKKRTRKSKRMATAKLVEFQARTHFDSFYPMEVTALKEEKKELIEKHPDDFLLFPQDRRHPIRMLDHIPWKWYREGPSKEFYAQALRNEYYTLQIGLFASQKDIQKLQVIFTDLKQKDHIIKSSALTCFNTGGIDPYGNPFDKEINVSQGKVQPLWIGIDISDEVIPGIYEGSIKILAENAETQSVQLKLHINDESLSDRGDGELWRHSRLRWLNSTLGLNNQPSKGYEPIKTQDDLTYHISGKTVSLGQELMPHSINIFGTEILAEPIALQIETDEGVNQFSGFENLNPIMQESGVFITSWENHSRSLILLGEKTLEADGYLNYKIRIKALNEVNLKDIRLEIPLRAEVAKYVMGMELPGAAVPTEHEAKWNGPHDSFWIGNHQGGVWCELRGGAYHGPLLNLYKPEFPDSWYNQNLGGFRIIKDSNKVKAIVYSGKRNLKAGEELEFEWSFLITPVKNIDYPSQFINRYYHNGGDPLPSNQDLKSGVKVVNLHHANEYNPHINYPFIAVDEMKFFVDSMHRKGQKVKIYYTIRELTNYTTELWALRSLGFEILGNGRGGGYPWLREHLVSNYRPQWYQYFPDKSADASIVNAPGDSRWYNYYIEGLAWLIRNVDIDGLYLDDVSYDRRILKRIRKVLDQEKPGCLIDLHSNTGFSKGPATQYAEFIPFVDKLWFGESFKYDEMAPENWLVEVSGIPFGLMGDMLHRGGNRWLGMLFGMTVRHPWYTDGVICDPRPIWKIWDHFGIHDSRMVGFWENTPIVTTNNKDVKATAYLKKDSLLISLGNFSDVEQKINLKIDWEKTGINASNVQMTCPEIEDFQPHTQFKLNESITIQPRKGWIILLQ